MQYCHVCKSQTTSGPPVLEHRENNVTTFAFFKAKSTEDWEGWVKITWLGCCLSD